MLADCCAPWWQVEGWSIPDRWSSAAEESHKVQFIIIHNCRFEVRRSFFHFDRGIVGFARAVPATVLLKWIFKPTTPSSRIWFAKLRMCLWPHWKVDSRAAEVPCACPQLPFLWDAGHKQWMATSLPTGAKADVVGLGGNSEGEMTPQQLAEAGMTVVAGQIVKEMYKYQRY